MNQLKDDNIFEVLEDFNSIYLQDIVNLFDNQIETYKDLDKSLKMPEFLGEYRRITEVNTSLINEYIEAIQSLNSVMNYNLLKSKKKNIDKEYEFLKLKQKSSDLAAKIDLLSKLNDSILENKKKFKYLNEDFRNLNNQYDQIIDSIDAYNNQIKELNKKKRDSFNRINKLTREMDDPNKKGENFADKIKKLQINARESQYLINQTKLKLSEVNQKHNEISPKYKKLKNNLDSLMNIIKKDEKKVSEIKLEISTSFDKKIKDLEINFNEISSFKTSQEIEIEIEIIDKDMNHIIETTNDLNEDQPQDLTKVINRVKKIEEKLIIRQKNIQISQEKDEILDSLDKFRILENLLKDLEALLNKFLNLITLSCEVQIVISDDNRNFSIKLIFIRTKKERIVFDGLTTPEKVFFIISLFMSIKVHLKTKNIIFSNLYLPPEFNKRGSVYRTISKIIPVFREDELFKEINKVIFIISNLEMKKPIENIKIVNIKEEIKE